MQNIKGWHWQVLGWLLILVFALNLEPSHVSAQDEIVVEEGPLIDQQPFDWIHLTDEAGGESFKVFLLELPNRPDIQRPENSQRLPIVLKQFPDRRYQVAWKWIDRIEFYEEMVLSEAKQDLIDKDFIGAFQGLSFLMRNYPKTPQLEDLRQRFLFSSLSASYASQQLELTLSALEELRQTAPKFRSEAVLKATNSVVGSILDRLEQTGDAAAAQALTARLKSTYGTIEVIQEREKRLGQQAETQLLEAEEDFRNQRYRDAHRKALISQSLAADLDRSRKLLSEISRVHPIVRVGVTQRSGELDASSLTSWPARRIGTLVDRPVMQFQSSGNEGGNYGFAFGRHRLSNDYQQLVLSLESNQPVSNSFTGLTELLLQRASPDDSQYDPAWAAVMRSVEMRSSTQLVVNLQRPHVLPHALMQWTIADDASRPNQLSGRYQRAQVQENETVFVLRPTAGGSGQPAEIVELFYEDSRQLINDLLRGQIDIVDQIFPADARKLAADARLRIMTYALPTTHMLIPNSDHQFLQSEKFRRALLYATDREGVLQGELLGSSDPRDGRLVSGPFPLGGRETDSLAYAYDEDIRPVAYNPQLAKLLVVIVQQELSKSPARNRTQPPTLEKIIVGCPDFEFARVAVQAMIQQWAIVGVSAEMLVLSDGSDREQIEKCDLLYVCTTMWEPATDIQRLLGGLGVTASNNPYVVQGLERVRDARNWREVRGSLRELHQIIAYHLPILPLWQVSDRFAVRRNVQGITDGPSSLYQEINNWRLDFSGPNQ